MTTYALIVAPFLAVTAIVTLWSARRPGFGRRMRASGAAAIVLILLTAVFDNVMIAAGLVDYPPAQQSGLRIGIAPIEDFSYAICAAFLVPAAFALLGPRERA